MKDKTALIYENAFNNSVVSVIIEDGKRTNIKRIAKDLIMQEVARLERLSFKIMIK